MRFLILIIVLFLLSCKSTNYPKFSTPKKEISAALTEFRQSDAEILFLVMIDRTGSVVRVRVVSDKLAHYQAVNMFKKLIYKRKYFPASSKEPDFREFFLHYGVNTTVEYVGAG